MRIAINALCAENRSGTGRYTRELILALARVDRVNTYCILCGKASPLPQELERATNFRVYPIGPESPVGRVWFEQRKLNRNCWKLLITIAALGLWSVALVPKVEPDQLAAVKTVECQAEQNSKIDADEYMLIPHMLTPSPQVAVG